MTDLVKYLDIIFHADINIEVIKLDTRDKLSLIGVHSTGEVMSTC